MRLSRFVLRRALQAAVVLLVVSAMVFWLVAVVPGNPGRSVLGPYATAAQVAQWNAAHGMDGSTLDRYLSWLGGFVRGEWGTSLMLEEPVRDLVLERLSNTMLLGVLAFAIMAPLAGLLGFWQAHREGRASDRAATVASVSLAAMPEFVVGVALMLVFGVTLGWFPVHAEVGDGVGVLERLRAMVLPALTIAAGTLGYVARMVRSGAIEALAAPYHRTAVLKGLSRGRIVVHHLARNALLPAVAVLGMQLAAMLSGVVVVETLFNYPGLGRLVLDAILKHDVLVLEAATLMIAIVASVVLFATDLAYAALDPRVRREPAR